MNENSQMNGKGHNEYNLSDDSENELHIKGEYFRRQLLFVEKEMQ